MLCLSVIPLGLALYFCTDFSVLQFLVLGVAFAISVIINKYRYKIPGTQTNISAKELVIFWGILWLGLPGGIFLSIGALLGEIEEISQIQNRRWLFRVFANSIAALVSTGVLYLTLGNLTPFSEGAFATRQIGVGSLIFAIGAMAFAHFWLLSLFLTLYLKFSSGFSFIRLWKENLLWGAGTYLVSAGATVLVHLLFLRFGLEFGLVLLPLVIGGHLIYRIFIRKLAQKTREIREASRIHLATVEALATAIDARDQIGVGHVRRTQIYAVGMGELLGLSADEILALKDGALLHGIGKLAVPDNILNKPERLTPAEKEKMKIHSSVGASIIETINFPYPVVPTVKYHNERWDGTGYPKGLKKEEIPLTARILAVADAYDTLRGERPYRPAVSREQARRILLNDAGKQFDPQIVDLFLRNLQQLEAEIKKKGLAYSYDKRKEAREEAENTDYVEQIKRANREVFTLYELARVFSSSLNLEETLALFAEKVREIVPFDTCAIYLMEESGDFASAAHTLGKNSLELENKRIRKGEGATGFVLQEGQPIHNINPALDFSFDHLEFVENYSAMISMPLLAEDRLLGAVSIYSCELDYYGEEHLRLLEMIANIASDQISMALQHAESETRALTDPMTGLPNARSLQIHFEKEVARAGRNGSIFQLLMLDLDGFKAVNDTYGHKTGDRMLKEIAKVLKSQLRDYDFLARYAGDEFVIIVPETNSSGIQELCQRIEKAVINFKLPVEDGRYARVGVSLGASCYPTDGKTIDQIIIAADKKMYSVKAERKVKQTLPALAPQEKPLPPIEPKPVEKAPPEKVEEDSFIVELDESHIISSAIN